MRWLAMASWTRVFSGLKLGRVGGEEDQVDPFRHLEALRHVPAGAVEHEQDVLLGPGADRFGEVLQGQGEDLRVDLG